MPWCIWWSRDRASSDRAGWASMSAIMAVKEDAKWCASASRQLETLSLGEQ